MGGPGSGNRFYRHGKKDVVEDCLALDANVWRREGALRAGVRAFGTCNWSYPGGGGFTVNFRVDTLDPSRPAMRLSYSWVWKATKRQDSADYLVRLTTTRPRFGGLRWWFVCPLVANGVPCGRRAGKLYLPPGGRYFGCRLCHGLTYTSCQESHKYDAAFRRLARDTGFDFETVKRVMNGIGNRNK